MSNPADTHPGYPPTHASAIEGRHGFILRFLLQKVLSGIQLLPEQVARTKELARQGTVVYVLKSRSSLETLLCYERTRRQGLPVPAFACEANMTLFHSPGFLLRSRLRGIALKRRKDQGAPSENGTIKRWIGSGGSVILYLQDPDAFARRFLRFRRDPFVQVLEVQSQLDRPIFMVPMMVIWGRERETLHPQLDEIFLGQRTNPSDLRVLLNFIRLDRNDSHISQAEPLDLRAYLEARKGEDFQGLAFKLRRELFQRLRTERRLVTGPVARSRQQIIERVLLDERVQQAIHRRAKRRGRSAKTARKEAYRLIREIAADLHPVALRFWDWVMRWALRTLYDGLEVDTVGLEKARAAARHSNLVFVPCHRSHMDYMVLAYVFYHHYLFPPLIAAGLNLAFWPLGFLFRKSGAFFIRRQLRGSVLYPVILTRYVRVLLEERYPLEFFIEGGRSRSGKMILPKLGFLTLLVDGYRTGACQDISFVPVAIAYERIMEEGAYLREIEGEEKPRESFIEILKSRDVIRRRYGRIYINFNEPISLKAMLARTLENPDSSIRYTRQNIPYYLAYEIAQRINQVMVVVPRALMASALLCAASVRGVATREALRLALSMYRALRNEGARFSASLEDPGRAAKVLRETLELLSKERYVHKVSIGQDEIDDDEDVVFELQERNRKRLDYYKNSILHYLVPHAFVSLSLLTSDQGAVSLSDILADAVFLRELFQQEFVFLPEEDPEARIRGVLDRMCEEGLIREEPGGFSIRSGHRQELLGFARLIQGYFESYYVVASSLKHIAKRRLSQRRFLWRVRFTGHRLFQTGKIQRPESLSQINYLNAIQYLVDRKIILRQVDRTFREGVYYRLNLERRPIHWRRIKSFLRVYR